MKKILFSLFALTLSLITQVLRGDDSTSQAASHQPGFLTGGVTMRCLEPQLPILLGPGYLNISDKNFQKFLTENQANTPDHPINVSLNETIQVSLQGEESYSNVYCSGAGFEHGYRWEYDDNAENDVLSELCFTGDFINYSLINPNSDSGWTIQPIFFNWSFKAQQVGTVTLTFKKYYYSNAMLRNLDGSLPWKDPIETIQFTIKVVDDAGASVN